MKARNQLTVINTTIVLLLGITGCTLSDGGPQVEGTPKTANSPTPGESTTSPVLTAVDPGITLRDGIYLDEWTKNITVYFQRTANLFLHENEDGGSLSPGDLQDFLDEAIAADTPHGFNASASTTAFDNFTIMVWHRSGSKYTSEDTAYRRQSDPEVTPSPVATPSNSTQTFDSQVPELLYKAAVGAGDFMRQRDGQVPTDDYMRAAGFIPEGWQWKLSRDELEPDYYLFGVWHPDAHIYNSPDTAATYNSYPQPELRPAYNVDVKPYVPIVGFLSPP